MAHFHSVAPIPGPPPGASPRARRLAQLALAPVERFLRIEASSGIVLLGAAVIALVWANSRFRASYAELWHSQVGVKFGGVILERDLHFCINEGLMTIFFFVVGLEIRREIHRGELSEPKRAALPLAAALGGMIAPAVIFFAINRGLESASGWGVPMATDIAFAVGVLALLGRRVSPALRILLLALAVIDDVGAILVIAVFYSSSIAWPGLLLFGLGLLLILGMQRLGIRSPWAYVPPALISWTGAYVAGVHPTLAGVATGLMTPATAWFGTKRFLEHADVSVQSIRAHDLGDEHGILPHLDDLNRARREAVSPLERVQHALHGWVAFGVMPLFAFANAGVPLGNVSFDGVAARVSAGVGLGLVFGKPLGIVGLSWACSRIGLVMLPRGVSWPQVAVVGCVGGIGFTMALFIAELAFPTGSLLEAAKLTILAASGTAGLLGLVAGRVLLSEEQGQGAALTADQAESQTDQ